MTGVATVLCALLAATASVASTVVVVADSTPILSPKLYTEAGNQAFYQNVLGNNSEVGIITGYDANSYALDLQDFYAFATPGVSTTYMGSPSAPDLSGFDLVVVFFEGTIPYDDSMVDAVIDYALSGGDLLLSGEYDYIGATLSRNAALETILEAIGSEIRFVDAPPTDAGTRYTEPQQIAVHPLTADVQSFRYGGVGEVMGGQTLFYALDTDLPFAAVDEVPEPETPVLLAAGIVALASLHTRRQRTSSGRTRRTV